MNRYKDTQAEQIDWRDCFDNDLLSEAEYIYDVASIRNLSISDRSASVEFQLGRKSFRTFIGSCPTQSAREWDLSKFYCSCNAKRSKYVDLNSRPQFYRVCSHQAALLMLWEEERGPWEFPLSQKQVEARAREPERLRIAREIEAQKKEYLPASDYISPGNENTFFDIPTITSGLQVSRYAVNQMKLLIDNGEISFSAPEDGYDYAGHPTLSVEATFRLDGRPFHTSLVLRASDILERRCTCSHFYYTPASVPLCEHELLLLEKTRAYIDAHNIGDATDAYAMRLLGSIDLLQESGTAGNAKEKSALIELKPLITRVQGDVLLSFRIGLGGKLVSLRNLQNFVDALDNEATLEASKTVTIDFSRYDFTPESRPWAQLIQRRVGEIATINQRLEGRAEYIRSLTAISQESLTGSVLDSFYDLAENTLCDYTDKTTKTKGTLRIVHTDLHIHLKTNRISSRQGAFLGVEISGSVPAPLEGSLNTYLLSDESLSRLSREETQALHLFRFVMGDNGQISFRVGKEHLAEFYHRSVPFFQKSPYIEYEDSCADEALPLLPPEPKFIFRLDIEEYACICEVDIFYDEDKYPLTDRSVSSAEYRDFRTEDRVRMLTKRYFPNYDQEMHAFWAPVEDDFLYQVLQEVIPALSKYGEVQGTDAFNRYRIRSQPTVQVGVRIESGLMDISVLSSDLSEQELLGILTSYRKKKKYHKLQNGSFIDLQNSSQLDALDTIAQSVDLATEDIIRGRAGISLYRALYLDEKLKEHDELVANRDKTYRTLVSNFNAIREAEYEVPQTQANILRPYQEYGFKWLRTLFAAGFGGILADDMGLGKTLQTITLLQSLKDNATLEKSLIVCPASLIYNWQEEFSRFAPNLTVTVIAGLPRDRKEKIQSLQDNPPDICITSYDLLRKDLESYRDISFSVMILDEAQYIKNQNAGLTKAVKAIRSTCRFALTGTPIENRLSELWSIFDFLMPGFLYSYKTFSSRFETPITKKHDAEASAQLRQMTSPYILRRLKADVLKDLPEKLEEVRFTRFSDAQRKVYDGQVVRMKQILEDPEMTSEDRFRILTEMTRIRQICCDPSLVYSNYADESTKRIACMDLIQSAMSGGHRMLVFSQFTSMLELLETDLKKESIPYMKLTGATPKEQRLRMVRDFNEGDTPVFLISLKAGGTGLNLTGADVVIHYDPWWNLAAQNQATDRAHRIGQANQVTVYRLIVKDTIEEKILALQESKKDLADSVLTGEHTSITTLSNEELLALLA